MGAFLGIPVPPLAYADQMQPQANHQYAAQAARRRLLLLASTGHDCCYCGRAHDKPDCPGCGAPST